MTQPERADFLTTQGVSEQLGVTTMRVRQMVTEGKLPPPTNLGTRFYVWHVADVAAVQALQAGDDSSPPTALLATPPQPLPRYHDGIVHIGRFFDMEPGAAHVRVWSGPAPEGLRTIVLLGELHEGISVLAHLRDLVQLVNDWLLPVPAREALWFSYLPGNDLHPHHVDHLMWSTREPEPAPETRLGRVVHALRRGGARATRRDDEPRQFRPAGMVEVERLTGAPIEAYPPPAYTPDTIEQWQSTGHTVDVVHDSVVAHPLMRAVRQFTHHQGVAVNEYAQAAGDAAWLLADDVRERLAYIERTGWNDGTTPRWGPSEKTPWPSTWAARLVPPELSAADHELLDQYPEPFSIPSTSTEHGPLLTLLTQLRCWSQQVDEYADEPDPDLYEALQRATSLLTFYLQVYGSTVDNYPDDTVRALDPAGEWDRAYLTSLTPTQIQGRRRRRLDTEIPRKRRAKAPECIRYFHDVVGHLVAHYAGSTQTHDYEWAALEWPLRAPQEIPAGSHIVADLAPQGGDRPAYIAEPDGRITPLPLPADRQFNQWNLGYPGGGPGALAYAISHTLAQVDGLDPKTMPFRWIDQYVAQATTGLYLPVDEIRRRYPT